MSIRKNITQPAEWWAAFIEQAKKEGKTLSEWIGDCCKHFIDTELEERPPAHRPKSN